MLEDETYNAACVRAELLGIEPPDKQEFEKARAERIQREAEELEAAEANLLENQEDSMSNVGGKLDELNTILSSTQKRISRLKDTARGSITSMFQRASIDISDGPSSSASGSRRNTNASGGDMEESMKNAEMQPTEDDGEIKPIIPTEKIRQAKLDIQKKMGSHLDKLDSLLHKAENAEIAMSEQTKQMRKMTD